MKKSNINNLIVTAIPNIAVTILITVIVFIIAPETLALARMESEAYEYLILFFWVSIIFYAFWLKAIKKALPLGLLIMKIIVDILKDVIQSQKNNKHSGFKANSEKEIHREYIYKINQS